MSDSLNRREDDERPVLIAPVYSMVAAIGPGGGTRRPNSFESLVAVYFEYYPGTSKRYKKRRVVSI